MVTEIPPFIKRAANRVRIVKALGFERGEEHRSDEMCDQCLFLRVSVSPFQRDDTSSSVGTLQSSLHRLPMRAPRMACQLPEQ